MYRHQLVRKWIPAMPAVEASMLFQGVSAAERRAMTGRAEASRGTTPLKRVCEVRIN